MIITFVFLCYFLCGALTIATLDDNTIEKLVKKCNQYFKDEDAAFNASFLIIITCWPYFLLKRG